jgi:hypothetical protein
MAFSLSDFNLKKNLLKSFVILSLFYLYSNVLLSDPFMSLLGISCIIFCYVASITWNKTNKAMSILIFIVFFILQTIMFFDLLHSFMIKIELNNIKMNKFYFQTITEPKSNIIFIETSTNRNGNFLNFKQNCAIESAAKVTNKKINNSNILTD